jgi:hypothetical protein
MSIGTILLRDWGYYPSGFVGVLLLVVIVLLLAGAFSTA